MLRMDILQQILELLDSIDNYLLIISLSATLFSLLYAYRICKLLGK